MNSKTVGNLATQLILWGLAIVLFAVAIWLFLADKMASGSASAGFGAIILFIANLNQIETFKGFGIEAKTRDLRQAIEDAESTMAKLNAMADQIESQSNSIMVLQNMLDETKCMAERAHAFAVINL
jgi:ABC-type multidrug transport system fused ATPase/permease subunit